MGFKLIVLKLKKNICLENQGQLTQLKKNREKYGVIATGGALIGEGKNGGRLRVG